MSTRMILIGACVAFLSAGCESGTEPLVDPDYFPLAVGNTWTYAPEDPIYGQPFVWRVTDRQQDTVRLDRGAAGSHQGPVTLLDGTTRIELVDGGEAMPFLRFTAGESWVHRDPWECDDGATVMAVEEPDPIVTPAGTFTGTIRIERRTTASCDDAGTMMEWWAPGVGLVRWDELNYYAGGPLSYLLVSYSVE
jgi:hypothetical protein